MSVSVELIEEIKLLSHYNLTSLQEGIKIHGSTNPEMALVAKRLFAKGILSQEDGGYLTDLGIEVVEHVQSTLSILKS